jgi:hypothetical protein
MLALASKSELGTVIAMVPDFPSVSPVVSGQASDSRYPSRCLPGGRLDHLAGWADNSSLNGLCPRFTM